MIDITERKIAGLAPRWAPFPGFSLLFDAPGTSLRREGGIETLACDVENDPALAFYRRVLRGFRSLRPNGLMADYGLCPLPPPSYHVTAFDVANVADLPRCHPESQDELRETLERLPDPAAFDADVLARSRDFAKTEWNLTFRYGALRVSNTLVVHLDPVNRLAFDRFVAARAELSRAGRTDFGIGAGERYTPHLSLGYFINDAGTQAARAHEAEWNEALRDAAADVHLEFRTVSLYGFTDMATFFRKA